jgi:hypothetical protein
MRVIYVVVAAATLTGLVTGPGAGRATPSDYPITAVPLTAVTVTDGFWAPKMAVNRTVSIPHILRQNEATGRVANFLKAAHRLDGAYQGQRYNDTDTYKVIEAASYSLAAHPDGALDKQIDDLIAIVAAAQEPDGYLYTPRTIDPKNPPPGTGPERWAWEFVSHELYDQGHMIEAAVAHFQATGKRTFLDVAIKSADLICKSFGPAARHDAPGHEEIELALVKLYRATGDRRYLDEAKFFLDQRGTPHTAGKVTFPQGDRFFMYNDLGYRQDQQPVIDVTRAVGHAVRATYLFAGLTDAATLFDDAAYGRAVDTVFKDVVGKRMYITGGLGSVGSTEAFGDDYVLPNRSAYTETCASIGGLLWYHRLFLRSGDAAPLDVFERTLYNGYLSGVSIAGDTFFYQNPLESAGTGRSAQRSAYFDVACCPANLARLMAQLPGLIYAERAQPSPEVFVNLLIGSEARLKVGDRAVRVTQQTEYPWQGGVTIHVDPDRAADFSLTVRIPGWTRDAPVPSDLYHFSPTASTAPTATLNGRAVAMTIDKGFLHVRRRWQPGDVVELTLPMPIRRVLAHEAVTEDRGKAAIQRGPLVYCLEAVDNGGATSGVTLPLDAPLTHAFRKDLLGGIEVITGPSLTAIPYYAWANRGRGEMSVWIAHKIDR